MKSRTQNLTQLTAAFLIAIFIFTGCSINDSDVASDTSELTSEELELAGQIIAESVSDQKDGIFSSLNDAFTLPSNSNFSQSIQEAENYSTPAFKAISLTAETTGQSNYSYTYDPESGKHLVTQNRSINEGNISKETTVELEYIYYDSAENFVVSPRIDNDRIETIDFLGKRTGSIESGSFQSNFDRSDQFIIEGLTSNSQLLTIDGLHQGSGEFRVTRENGDLLERYYDLTVEFINVQVNNQTVESNGNLKNGVTGTLSYELLINKSVNGDESVKTINGTIEFNGDGTALLKFRNLLSQFKIKLESGSLLEEDEFEGFIRSVNTSENSITLFNSDKFILNSESQISSESALNTLIEIESALENDIRVKTEGSFITDAEGSNIIQTVEFNFEDEDVEFDELIESVNISENSITLDRSGTLFLTDSTQIDSDGDFLTLESVQNSLENGNFVKAEGEFQLNSDDSKTILKVEFELEDQEFEDFIELADTTAQSFTLEDGTTYFVNDSTKFDENISSIEELDELLSIGYKIEAEGTYKIDADDSLVVTEIKFDIEDFDESDFEGVVLSVNISDQTLTLNNGLVFKAISRTKFKKNIRTLNELAVALNENESVSAEGEYFTDANGENILIEVEFSISDEEEEESEEGEFEGVVQTVNLNQQTFVLKNGLLLQVDSDTEFDDDEIESLEKLSELLDIGHHIEAEGSYVNNGNGKNVVVEVEFDVEEIEFEEKEYSGEVQSVNLNLSFFIVRNGLVVYTNSDTEFADGEIETLEELEEALRSGVSVHVSGEYFTNNRNRNFALSVEFERIDEFEESEFEGTVQNVNLNQNSILIQGGLMLYLDSSSEIEGDDINSIEDLDSALSDGISIHAEGTYYNNNRGRNIIVQIEFEADEDNEGDNGDNGGQGDDNSDNGGQGDDNSDNGGQGNDNSDNGGQGDDNSDNGGQGDDNADNGGQGDDNDGQDDDDDNESSAFSGEVQNVNLNQQTFLLKNGVLLYVNSDTEFKGDDIQSLEDLNEAVGPGSNVEATGTYHVNQQNQKIVIEVEFEI